MMTIRLIEGARKKLQRSKRYNRPLKQFMEDRCEVGHQETTSKEELYILIDPSNN